MTALCQHGLVQLSKFGVDQVDGLEICRNCGLPTADSYHTQALDRSQGQPQLAKNRVRHAREQGSQSFELQLEVSRSDRDVRWLEADSGRRTESDHGHILGEMEAEGRQLENVGYVFVPTGQSSRQKMLGTGESVAVSGSTIGIYPFRALPA